MKYDSHFKYMSLTLIWVWLGIFALLSFLLVLGVSFLEHDATHIVIPKFTWSSYTFLFHPILLKIFGYSFVVAITATASCLLIGYPFAYFLSQIHIRYKSLLMLFLVIPFWTSSLVRSYAVMAILKTKGILNTILLSLGLIHEPLQLLFTNTAVTIGLVYNLLPFMVLPLYANFERLDERLLEAAEDLGASRFMTLYRILIPLTKPGIYAGIMMVFLPSMTLFYIPDLLGGARSVLLGNLIENQFLFANNWPVGSAISVLLTFVMGVMLLVYWRNSQRSDNKQQVLL